MSYTWPFILLVVFLARVGAADSNVVHFAIDISKGEQPISPYIYGVNGSTRPLNRLGGNRWTAYNWENNASNAGSDWHFQSDDELGKSNSPGAAVLPAIQTAARLKQALIITIPVCGYVAADKGPAGDVNQTPDYLNKRFRISLPKKPAAFTLWPDGNAKYVYEDEFVNWIEKHARVDPNQQIFYSLDNEPDLWSETHARIHPNKVTYAELVQKTIAYAGAIKDVKPDATILGFVSYGWNGFMTLQDAPDANKREFLPFFLSKMKEAEQQQHRRLVDVLDLHWYPEARGGGIRITDKNDSPPVAEARMQAPRSLWDATYKEDSWITQYGSGPIALIPRVKKIIAANYPGTKLSFSEYDYGGGNSISGAIAEADALGIFGQRQIFAAAWWDLGLGNKFVNAALDMYLNYDGQGSHFGDTSVSAVSDNPRAASVYAAVDKNNPSRLTIVLINRSNHDITADISIASSNAYQSAKVFRILPTAPSIQASASTPPTTNPKLILPATSISLMCLQK